MKSDFEKKFPSISKHAVISKSSQRGSIYKIELGLDIFKKYLIDKQNIRGKMKNKDKDMTKKGD